MSKKLSKDISKYIRLAIQIVFFLVMPSAFSSAFGAVKEAAGIIARGEELSFTPFARIFLFLIVFTMIFGRIFCGYACAFGSLGDWIYGISKFIRKKAGRKPKGISDKATRLQVIKYAMLIGIIVACFLGYSRSIGQNSPWTVFSLLISKRLPGEEQLIGIILLALILIGMALKERFFCQFLCPLGAVFSLLPILPTGRLRRHEEGCIKGCTICRRNCPVGLKLGESEFREGECIHCNVCMSGCPRKSIRPGVLGSVTSSDLWTVLEAAILLVLLRFVI